MKRLIAITTCMVLLLSLLPLGAVSADTGALVVVGGVPLQEGDYLAVGADAPRTTKPTGGYAYYKAGVLTLNNYTYEGPGYEMSKDYYALVGITVPLTVRLVGKNALIEEKPYGYVSGIDSVSLLTIMADSDAELIIRANSSGISARYYVDNTLTITGGTFYISGGDYGIYTVNKKMIIQDSHFHIQAENTGIYAGSMYGSYESEPSINEVGAFINNAQITIQSLFGGITSYRIVIDDSEIATTGTGDYGISADTLIINSGNVTTTGAPIRGYKEIIINGGTVTATGAASGIYSQRQMTINGGNVTAIGKAWGIRSISGTSVINGGTVVAIGNTQSGIYTNYQNIHINGGWVEAISNTDDDRYWALKSVEGQVVVNENLLRLAARTADGALETYDPADNKLYDRVVICGEHIYDGGCDSKCNFCNTAREAKAHTWKNGKCAVCGKASPSKVKLTAQSAAARYAKTGATVSAKVTAKGAGLKYQWYVKNAGASKYSKSAITKATYAVTMTSKVKGRRVYCVVTDQYGNKVQSKTFILRQSVSIATQPKTVAVKKNVTAKATVKAKGDGLKYTWYVKNEGAKKYTKSAITKAAYSVKMTAKVKNRLLYCVVTDRYGNKVQTKTVRLNMK